MLKNILFSAPPKPPDGPAGSSGKKFRYFLSFALITGLALLTIGLNPGPLSAQGDNPSEIIAGQTGVSPAPPTEAASDPAGAFLEEASAQPVGDPDAALPPTPEAASPAQTPPDQAASAQTSPDQAAPAQAPASTAPTQAPASTAPTEAKAVEVPTGQPDEEELAKITKELARADTACRQGDYIAALDSLWAAQEMVWRRAPLAVRNVAFVTEQPENFGTYKPKIGEDFKSPEPLILYCEPIGFTQIRENGTYRYSIIGAFDILDAHGKVLGGQKNLGPYEQSGYRTFSTETMLVMTIGIHGLPAGSYVMRITLTDNLERTKSVQLDKPFNIVE